MVWKMTLLLWEIEGKVTSKEAKEVTGKLQPNQVAAWVTCGPADSCLRGEGFSSRGKGDRETHRPADRGLCPPYST